MKASEYQTYLASREWALKRERVRERALGKCERCHVAEMNAVHHLTYARVGDELLSDLIAICDPCHEFVSGKNDTDPIHTLKASVTFDTHDCCLLCPCCGGQYLHQCRVDVFSRPDGEDQPSISTVVHHHDPNQTWTKAKNPSLRRQGVIIYFWCETCAAGSPPGPTNIDDNYELPLGLAISQEKGITSIRWVNNRTPPRRVWKEEVLPRPWLLADHSRGGQIG
jgi:hypothetical protein